MFTNERLFYNKFKYRIRFNLRKGLSLLRNCSDYIDTQHLLDELEKLRQFWIEREIQNKYQFMSSDQWKLNGSEKDDLVRIFHFREEFRQQPSKQIRVEVPLMDFYTCDLDYVAKITSVKVH